MDQLIAAEIGNRTAVFEPGAGHRAQRTAPRRRAVDDLRLEPVVGSPTRPATKEIYTVARLRSAGRRRYRPHARSQHPRRRPAGLAQSLRPRISKGDNVKLTEYFESIRDIEAASTRPTRKSGSKAAADAGQAGHAAAEERAAAERSGSHEADARPGRPRLPDGQDAGRHADAEQRPVADELQVRRRRPGRPAPRPHPQREEPRTRRRCT